MILPNGTNPMDRFAKYGPSAIGSEAHSLYLKALATTEMSGLLSQVEAVHSPTMFHLLETARMMAAILTANVVDFDSAFKEDLVCAAALHDIAKPLCVDAAVLDKSDRPTGSEWEQITQHPHAGFRLLTELRLAETAIMVAAHHELQPRPYETEASRSQLFAEYGISERVLEADDNKLWIGTGLIAVADHFSSRDPRKIHQRQYIGLGRRYPVSELAGLIRADFVQAGRSQELGILPFLEKAIDIAQEVTYIDARYYPDDDAE